jgi:hypothetical protein
MSFAAPSNAERGGHFVAIIMSMLHTAVHRLDVIHGHSAHVKAAELDSEPLLARGK